AVRLSRGKLAALTPALAAAVAIPAVAFACTNVPSIETGVYSAPALSPTTVSLSGFAKQAPVEVRWDSVSGPILATVAGPSAASFVLTIPSASPTVHYLIAIQHADGAVYTARREFEITGAGGSTVKDTGASVSGSTSPAMTATDPGTGVSPIAAGLLVLST